jgi:hypoxanthine phosphoribosyltransferase
LQPEQLDRVIFTTQDISRRVRELGTQIAGELKSEGNGRLVVVSILRGAFIFLADLIRHIDLDISVDFMAISSYLESSPSASGVRIIKDLSESIYGRKVLIVEDIIDTGLTLSYIVRNLRERGPADLRICTLLDRAARRIAPLEIDYRGFEIGDEYVVGYGLDYLQKWRNLPFICTLKDVGPEHAGITGLL